MEGKQQQTIKDLKKSNKCYYPGCKSKIINPIMMPVAKITESGQLFFPNESKTESLQAPCSLCEYHMIFAEKGIINLVEINKLIQLSAPVELITIIETVLEAKEFQNAVNKARENIEKDKKKNAKITKKTQ